MLLAPSSVREPASGKALRISDLLEQDVKAFSDMADQTIAYRRLYPIARRRAADIAAVAGAHCLVEGPAWDRGEACDPYVL